MTQGSDDEAHKDELDLNDHSDSGSELTISAANGLVGLDEPAAVDDDDLIEHESVDTAVTASATAAEIQSQEDISELGQSEQLGLLEDSPSIPDDSPSVQVCVRPFSHVRLPTKRSLGLAPVIEKQRHRPARLSFKPQRHLSPSL
jgi:hypothetical protein